MLTLTLLKQLLSIICSAKQSSQNVMVHRVELLKSQFYQKLLSSVCFFLETLMVRFHYQTVALLNPLDTLQHDILR